MDPIIVELLSGPQKLKVCRACLAMDVKMLSLHAGGGGLNRDFYVITGLQLLVNDGMPYHICYICCALLKKAMKFRKNCYRSHKLLSKQALTPDFMEHINLLHDRPLIVTNIQIINSADNDCSNKSHSTELKEESIIDSGYKMNIADHNDDDGQSGTGDIPNVCDENIFIECLNHGPKKVDGKAELDIINTKEKYTKDNKKKRRNKTDFEKNDLSDILLNSSFDRLEMRLDKHKEDKYIDDNIQNEEKEKAKENDEIIYSDDDFKPLSSYATIIFSKNGSNHEIINKFNSKNQKLQNFVEEEKAAIDTFKHKRTKKNKKEIRTREAIEKFDKTYNCKVVELSIEEQVEVVRARAENKKYKYGKYKCKDCYTGFVVESKFNSHRKTHDPDISGNIECEICHLRFKNRLQYMKHALRHKYKYICKECGSISFSRSFAKNHYEFHAGIKYECQYCKQVFSKYATRVNHIRNKHGSAECGVCHDLFGPAGLALHMSLAHKQTYKCSSCDRVFNDLDALKRHMKSVEEDICDPNLRPCTRCGECFTMADEDLYKKHIEEHREMKKKKTSITYKMRRNRTSEKYAFPSNEEEDEIKNDSVGTDERVIKQFGAEGRRRGGEKTKLMCEICASDTFKSITALRYHQRIHTGEKPHACPTCPKRFRLTHTLQWHIRTHTGDRPYACAECPKAFKTNTALCRHKLVHTKERRHVCDLCGKAFQTSTNAKLHVRAVHMKVPTPPRVRNRKKRVAEPAETC